jgi:RNA polymerase sigma-70 factor (ECF subfamily)
MDGGETRSKATRIAPAERRLPGADPPAAPSDPGSAISRCSGIEGREAGPEERELIEAAKRNPARFAELYEDNFNRVYGYIARRVRDRAAAEDLTADVFHDALRKLESFEWRGVPFGAWLIRIAANAIVDRAKRAAREQDVLTANRVETSDPGASAAMEVDLEEIEKRDRLARLVEALPVDQRRVIKLRFVEEKSIRDIARELGRTEGAVKQLQFRGLQNLRTRMNREGKTEA